MLLKKAEAAGLDQGLNPFVCQVNYYEVLAVYQPAAFIKKS